MNFRFSKYKKNKEKKEGDSRRKVAVIVSIAIIIVVVGACVAAAAVAAGNRIDVRIIDEDAGEYMPVSYTHLIRRLWRNVHRMGFRAGTGRCDQRVPSK